MSSATRRFWVLFLLVALATLGWAQEEAPDIGPGHTYARLMLLAAELELIRAETGKQSPGPTGIDIGGVAPREVYFQAVALFQKANRLSFEYARDTAEQPPLTKLDITPAQVMLMIDAALERVLHVKRELNIPESSIEPPIDETLTPTDVFNATLEVSRQLDEILDQPFSPSE